MPRSVEAVVDERGSVRLLEPVRMTGARRAFVTILDEAPQEDSIETGPPEPTPWAATYEPVRVIAGGGMGRVHLARHRHTGALVCVKELLADTDRAALQQECRALARLRHPCIIRLINFEARGSNPYLVAEFAAGVSLRHYIGARVLAQEPLAAAVARRMFEALDTAHAEQVIHRDLKPDNVIADESDGVLWPKILDFGLAIVDRVDHRNAMTGIGMAVGTPIYMAPEQFSGHRISPACDVYAVGQMCWEMLAGRRAFSGDLAATLQAKMRIDGLDLGDPRLSVSEAFRALIHACTRLDAGARPTAAAAAQALSTLLPGLPTQANLVPRNLAFTERTDQRPTGWFDGFGYVDRASMNYQCRVVDPEGRDERAHVRLERRDGERDEFGVLMQRVPAAHLAGVVVRVGASIRTEGVVGGTGLWLRADGDRAMLAFYNMHERWIKGTTEWTDHVIELKIPSGTTWLNFGIVQDGDGATVVKDVAIDAQARDGSWAPLGCGARSSSPGATRG